MNVNKSFTRQSSKTTFYRTGSWGSKSQQWYAISGTYASMGFNTISIVLCNNSNDIGFGSIVYTGCTAFQYRDGYTCYAFAFNGTYIANNTQVLLPACYVTNDEQTTSYSVNFYGY